GIAHRRGEKLGNDGAERSIGEAGEHHSEDHHGQRPGEPGGEHGPHHEPEDADGGRDPEHGTAAAPLGEERGDGDGKRKESHGEQLHPEERAAAVTKGGGSPGKREHGEEIKDDEGGEADQDTGNKRLEVAAKQGHHGQLSRLAPVERLLVDRRLRKAEPNPQAEEYQHRAGQKWDTPSKGEELPVREATGEQQEDSARKNESGGRAELREHSIESALFRRSIFNRQQHRAAPFAAEPKALAEAEDGKQQRRGHADHG